MSISKTERNKGKSLISFPKSFTVLDIETTGHIPEYFDIIEVAALRVNDGVVTDKFSSLINPRCEIDSFIEDLTGITNSMLECAPGIEVVLPELKSFIGNSVIIGHNVNYDINFLYDAFKEYLNYEFSNDFVDTMRISRNLYKDAPHHRLIDLCSRYNIDYSGAHRSLVDCQLTLQCYLHLIKDINSIFGSLGSFVDTCTKKKSHHNFSRLKASDINPDSFSFDETHPLYKKVCVFTGTLEKMSRKDAMQIVANLGGVNADSVTKKTNFLILADHNYCKSLKGGKSSKQKKAEALKISGNDIEIIPESVFYDMLESEGD